MATTPDLALHEELLLLALDDESGAGRSDLALGAGILAELTLQGALVMEVDGKKTFVQPGGSSAVPVVDELLAECVSDVRDSKKRREVSHWVTKFLTKSDLKARTARPLVERGVLDERKRKILFFELTQYPEVNPLPEAQLTERLRSALEHDHVTPDDRTVALLAIANTSGLLGRNLDKKLLRQRKDRIKSLTEGDQISAAVKAAIDAVTTIIIVAGATAAATA